MFGAEAKRRIMLGTFASSAGYTDKYYTYKDDPRDLFIFDEAYFGTLYKSLDLRKAIQQIEGAIVEEEGKNLGLPMSFLKLLKKRLKRANRFIGKPHGLLGW